MKDEPVEQEVKQEVKEEFKHEAKEESDQDAAKGEIKEDQEMDACEEARAFAMQVTGQYDLLDGDVFEAEKAAEAARAAAEKTAEAARAAEQAAAKASEKAAEAANAATAEEAAEAANAAEQAAAEAAEAAKAAAQAAEEAGEATEAAERAEEEAASLPPLDGEPYHSMIFQSYSPIDDDEEPEEANKDAAGQPPASEKKGEKRKTECKAEVHEGRQYYSFHSAGASEPSSSSAGEAPKKKAAPQGRMRNAPPFGFKWLMDAESGKYGLVPDASIDPTKPLYAHRDEAFAAAMYQSHPFRPPGMPPMVPPMVVAAARANQGEAKAKGHSPPCLHLPFQCVSGLVLETILVNITMGQPRVYKHI